VIGNRFFELFELSNRGNKLMILLFNMKIVITAYVGRFMLEFEFSLSAHLSHGLDSIVALFHFEPTRFDPIDLTLAA
jgi:hypothetical protein|tara:strand:+ start:3762 stop:3992 length:231 start_codon:yes stop_codon:yes gene_type:complete